MSVVKKANKEAVGSEDSDKQWRFEPEWGQHAEGMDVHNVYKKKYGLVNCGG